MEPRRQCATGVDRGRNLPVVIGRREAGLLADVVAVIKSGLNIARWSGEARVSDLHVAGIYLFELTQRETMFEI